jgi:hypothetical protein
VRAKLPLVLMTGITVLVVLMSRPWQSPQSGAREPASAETVSITVDTPPPARSRPAVPPIGEFMFLFDVSGSAHTGQPTDPFTQGAGVLVSAIASLRELSELTPERHRVGTIGATSLMQQPLCDITIPQATLFTKTDTSKLAGEIAACDKRLRSAAIERYTDIRGALHYAALSIRGQRPALRGIVLVTDLVEEPAPGQVSATPNLSGVCVAVFTMMTPAAARDPNALAAREHDWRARLTSWHARRVNITSVLGFEPQALSDFFRSCEGK